MSTNEMIHTPFPAKTLGALAPKTDFTLRFLENLELSNLDVHRSLFIDSIVRSSMFEKTNFSRSDFQGARIENSTFIGCDFSAADFRSCIISNCKFQDCSLVGCYLNDCKFESCQIKDCNLDETIFSESDINRSEIIASTFKKSSNILNKYKECFFDRTCLGNCTFLFNIIKNSRFSDVSMNAESIGYIYGIDKKIAANLEYLYLGENQKAPEGEDILELLMDQYKHRRWETGLALLRLNFEQESSYAALTEMMFSILRQAHKGILVKKDEIIFFEQILLDKYEDETLPVFAVAAVIDAINAYLSDNLSDKIARSRIQPSLQRLSNTLTSIISEQLENIEDEYKRLFRNSTSDPKMLKITFFDEPNISVAGLINDAVVASGIECSHKAVLIKIEYGSVIEYIQTCIHGVFVFWALLYGIEGCILQLTKIRGRLSVLTQKTLPKPFKDMALSRKLDPLPVSIRPFSNLFQFSKSLPWIGENSRKGIGQKNIKDVDLSD